jgi:diphosphomevalonate decarboxylase
MTGRAASAVACSNIALAKYWGKANATQNLPAVPSLSLTLDSLRTRTRVRFDPALSSDELWLDGRATLGRPLERVGRLLSEVRSLASLDLAARVDSVNAFPTAAGLASSASGFAALALAAARASGLDLDVSSLSALARRASASAARSIFGGFAALETGATCAFPLPLTDWPLRMLVAVVTAQAKQTASTHGMLHTQSTSPYYEAWVKGAPRLYAEIRDAISRRDFEKLGTFTERSALMMHATMMAAEPALIYFKPATLEAIECVQQLRRAGIEAYFTIDAGPNVKVLVLEDARAPVSAALSSVPGVERVLESGPGPGAMLLATPEGPHHEQDSCS